VAGFFLGTMLGEVEGEMLEDGLVGAWLKRKGGKGGGTLKFRGVGGIGPLSDSRRRPNSSKRALLLGGHQPVFWRHD
jgi:hypothetical protein